MGTAVDRFTAEDAERTIKLCGVGPAYEKCSGREEMKQTRSTRPYLLASSSMVGTQLDAKPEVRNHDLVECEVGTCVGSMPRSATAVAARPIQIGRIGSQRGANNSPLSKGEEGETTAVVKPSGGCGDSLSKSERTTPRSLLKTHPRAAHFVKGQRRYFH